jgi:hypothetical protein
MADLTGADLNNANLRYADLTRVRLRMTNLKSAAASFADFTECFFEPAHIDRIVFLGARGLSKIKFTKFKAVVDLREIAKKSGLRNEERALTRERRDMASMDTRTYPNGFRKR